MANGVFVTGTDTGVGKTLVSALLLKWLLTQYPAHARYFKPVQTGSDDDTQTVIRLTGAAQEVALPPAYSLRAPIAPSRAAKLEGVSIEIDLIQKHWISQNHYFDKDRDIKWIVEGAGGLLTPVADRQTIRELILAFSLPVIVVSSTRLGTLNHTLLTLAAIRSAGLNLAGYILSGAPDAGLKECLADYDSTPCLGEIPHLLEFSPAVLSHTIETCLDLKRLKKLWGPDL